MFTLETLRRVYNDKSGEYIQVGPDSDSLGMVQIDQEGQRITADPTQARMLADAIRACADELEPQGSEP